MAKLRDKIGPVIFVGGDVLAKAIPFGALPFITSSVSVKDFGVYSLFLVISSISYFLVGLSSQQSLSVLYFRESERWAVYASSVNVFWALACLFAMIPMAALALMFGPDHVVIASVIAFFVCGYSNLAFQIITIWYQVNRLVFHYAGWQIFRSAITAGGLLLYVFSAHSPSGIGLAYSFIGANVIIIFAALLWLAKAHFFKLELFSLSALKKISRESFSLTLNYISGWLRAGFDRVLLANFSTLAAVGTYALGFQLGSILGVIGTSVARVASVSLLSNLKTELDKATHEKHLWPVIKHATPYVGVLVLCYLALVGAAFLGFPLFFPAEYIGSQVITVLIGGAFLLQGIAAMLSPIVQFFEKTRIIGFLAIGLSLFSCVFATLGIYFFGELGAAWSFLAVWVVHCAFLCMYSAKELQRKRTDSKIV